MGVFLVVDIDHLYASSFSVKPPDFFSDESDYASGHGVKSVVLSFSDVFAGEIFVASLANNNTAGLRQLAGKKLNS